MLPAHRWTARRRAASAPRDILHESAGGDRATETLRLEVRATSTRVTPEPRRPQLVVLAAPSASSSVAPDTTGTSSEHGTRHCEASARRCRSSARPSDTSIMACAPPRPGQEAPSRNRASGRR